MDIQDIMMLLHQRGQEAGMNTPSGGNPFGALMGGAPPVPGGSMPGLGAAQLPVMGAPPPPDFNSILQQVAMKQAMADPRAAMAPPMAAQLPVMPEPPMPVPMPMPAPMPLPAMPNMGMQPPSGMPPQYKTMGGRMGNFISGGGQRPQGFGATRPGGMTPPVGTAVPPMGGVSGLGRQYGNTRPRAQPNLEQY